MLYILIIFAYTGAHGVAITTAEFNGESNCTAAAKQVNSMSSSIRGICVQRGR